MPRPRLRSVVQILLALFTATGFIGLVVEQVYQKLLGTLVGASTPAAAAVLAAYFAGLTLGSATYERWLRRRVANPLLAYAVLEGGVAALLVINILLFDRLLPLFAPLLALTRQSEAGLLIARLIVAAVWVLPPTFLMGASLPAIADSIAMLRLPSRHRLVALFYTINLLGAIIGSIAAPYLLFPELGLDGGLTICAALGAVVALIAQRLARFYSAERWQVRESPAATVNESSRAARTVILLLALSSGFVFFALETLWVHLLAAVIGNSVYAFATMLTVVLIGLGIGSGISVLQRDSSWGFLAAVIFSGGLALAVTHGLWPTIPHSLALVGRDVTSFGVGEFLRFRHALAVVLLPATLLGIWFPSLFRLPDFPKHHIGDFVGKTYAANAIGCVTGALAMTFLLLPRFGSETLLAVFAGLLIVTGALLAAWRRRGVVPLAIAAAIAGLIIVNVPSWDRLRLTSGEHVYFSENAVRPDSQLLYFREDAAGGITTVVAAREFVNGRPDVVRTLLTNGKFQGNDAGEKTAQAAFAMIPALMTRDFNDALVIGAGTGATADIVHALGFRNVRIAEIAPPIIDAARREFSDLNHRIFDQPNVRTDLEDGRNVLLLDRDARYDLITIEISSIWFSDATNLYSREFYRVARSRLRPHGVLQQWIQLHHIEPYDVLSVVATMRAVFPYVSLWAVGGQGIVVGSDEPQAIRADGLNHVRLLAPRLGWMTEQDFAGGIGAITRRQLLSPASVDRIVEHLQPIINTDRNRFLEYSTPRANLNRMATSESTIQRLSVFSDRAVPPLAQ